MMPDIRKKIDEIGLVVDALDETSQLMLKNNEGTPGGACLALLARKLEREVNELWDMLQARNR